MKHSINPQVITVYRWQDAPLELKHLAGGAAGLWLAVVPGVYVESEYLGWLDHMDGSLAPLVKVHPTLAGYEVWIGEA